MAADRRDHLGELFEAVRALPEQEREDYLLGECADDDALRAEVLSLVRVDETAGESLDELRGRLVGGAARNLLTEADDETAAELVGRAIGRYEVRELLGRGGMGFVFRAFDPTLGRDVALKFLPPRLGGAAAQQRLREEARAVSRLEHRNIAIVHEIGEVEAEFGRPWAGRLYIAMGFYAGETLARKIARGPLTAAEALDYAEQIAAGLERAHEAGIVHRDVTPANVVVTTRGVVKLIDFGVARVVGSDPDAEGTTPGTLAYMSPEQTRGKAVDARTDLWSLGVLLHEMLAGERPFRGRDATALVRAIREEDPRGLRAARRDLPEAVAEIARRCLQKDPSRRFRDAGELRAALRAAATGEATASALADGEDAEEATRRSRWMRLGAGAALASLALLVVAGLLSTTDPDMAPANSSTGIDPTGIAVLPLSSAEPDSALERLARDLVITLSATLDGIGDVQTADPLAVLAHSGRVDGPLTRNRGRALAASLGAGRFLHGGLTRIGSDVGIEASVYGPAGEEPLARVSLVGTPADVAALTDSVTLSLLRQLWEEHLPAPPSLQAVTTRSIPALRAYLEGEQALARFDMRSAIEAFERAFTADTTFWFAYWRSLYPRLFSEAYAPPDTVILRKVREHAHEFPVRERMLFEAGQDTTLSGQMDRFRELTDRFGFYGPAWYSYANRLVHFGPYLGTTLADAQIAMERAASLSPDFAAAWDHLLMIAMSRGDTTVAGRAVRELAATIDTAGFGAWRLRLAQFRYGLLADELPAPDSLSPVMDWVLAHPPRMTLAFATGLTADYHPAKQLAFNAALLDRQTTSELAAAAWLGNALSWIMRGAWDSALTAADRYAGFATEGGEGARRAYGIAVAGVVLGILPPDEAARRRPAGISLEDEASSPEDEVSPAAAELAWLDGMLAYARDDRAGIDRSLTLLRDSPATDAPVLRESLAAFAVDAAGDRERAARMLAERERATADEWLFVRLRSSVPLLIPLNRLLAGRWLRSLDRGAEAAALLTWTDALGGPDDEAWNRALGVTALLERAQVTEAAGRLDEARELYARFVRLFDRPDPGLQARLDSARAGLARLGPDAMGNGMSQ